MENNTQPVTAQELPNAAMHPRTGFPSEEAMKASDNYRIRFTSGGSFRHQCRFACKNANGL